MSTIIRRAGDVVGTPDWQLDLMKEREDERIWAELNRVDDKLFPVIYGLSDALSFIYKAESKLGTAADEVSGSPLDDKIMSLLNALEDLECDISKLKHDLEKEAGV